jgi:transketolase
MTQSNLKQLAQLVRYYILVCTTAAGSGHPSSSLSATDVMTGLMFQGFFKADLDNPDYKNNDRLIFSKGHASPLLYSLYAAAGKIDLAELKTLRQFDSRLEGHPTMRFAYTEAATGSLGQGLSVGVGMALNAKMDNLSYNTFVLMGDSEIAEGSVWEAMQLASHYNLDNLIGIVDVNRLGQRGETMYGHDIENYKRKIEAFGWDVVEIDGHDMQAITFAFETILSKNVQPHANPYYDYANPRPKMILAKTLKGKGVSFIENMPGWHGKALKEDELKQALLELGEIDLTLTGTITKPVS